MYLGNIDNGLSDKKWISLAFNIHPTLKNFKPPNINFNKKYADRVDLSKLKTFTIDPDGSRDFDDALSIQMDKKKENYILGIHIADVAYFVKRNSALDKSALICGNSSYLINFVLPMLPFSLSNGLCSLVPNEKRFTITTFVTIDKKGNIKHFPKNKKSFIANKIAQILLDKLLDDRNFN